jgi:prepilin-type processing-associated H-X9-DG protein
MLSGNEGTVVAIVVRCECGKEFQTRNENAGRHARCPECQRELIVPQPKLPPEGEFASLEELRPPPRTSGKAVASLVLGICSFVTCVLTAIPAIIFGILGLVDINNPKKNVRGQGMAIAGLVLGGVNMMSIPVLIALLLPAVQSAREAARRAQCTNNLKQIALAMFNYESANGQFPPAAGYGADGKPLLSWRVLILPYLEEESLYRQFHLDEPWDSPNNKPLGDRMPNVFRCPSENIPDGLTTYLVVVDPRSIFTGNPQGVSVGRVTDGTANTLMVVEAANAVPWSKPEDLSLQSSAPALGMGSKHPGGFNASMADGSVRFIRSAPADPIRPEVLKALVTRDGGERVASP